MSKIYNVVLILFLYLPMNGFSWGEKGHTLVAEVAFKHLDKKTRKKVLNYLDFKSLRDAANWMDDIKNDKTMDSLKTWHYVNFEKDQKVESSCCDNIIYRLEQTIHDLKKYQNFSKQQVKFKLLLLFHLIGDLHQPLHVGYGADKGGNDFQVQYNGKETNLHSLFDSKIIDFKKLSLKQVLGSRKYTKTEIISLQNGNVVSWSKQSRYFLPDIYKVSNRIIDTAYTDKNLVLIKSQIHIAGIRLAGILASSFR